LSLGENARRNLEVIRNGSVTLPLRQVLGEPSRRGLCRQAVNAGRDKNDDGCTGQGEKAAFHEIEPHVWRKHSHCLRVRKAGARPAFSSPIKGKGWTVTVRIVRAHS
jgi:hypothetical protein